MWLTCWCNCCLCEQGLFCDLPLLLMVGIGEIGSGYVCKAVLKGSHGLAPHFALVRIASIILSVRPQQDGSCSAAYMIVVHLSSFPQHQSTSLASSLMEHLLRDYFPGECSHRSSPWKDTLCVSQGLSRKQMAVSNWITDGEFNESIIRGNGVGI